MTKYIIIIGIVLSFSAFFLSCTNTNDINRQAAGTLIFDRSIGDTNEKAEYILKKPAYFDVNFTEGGSAYSGKDKEIFVLDESLVKIFSENGVGKAILGAEGINTPKFSNPRSATVCPSGLVSVVDARWIALFEPDLKFIANLRPDLNIKFINLMESHYLKLPVIEKVVSFSKTENIIECFAQNKNSSEDMPGQIILLYEKDSLLMKLAQHRDPGFVSDYRGPVEIARNILRFRGDFFWTIDSKKNLIYAHSRFDRILIEEKPKYMIHIVDLNTMKKTQIIKEYSQVELPDSIKNYFSNLQNIPPRIVNPENIVKIVNQEKYLPAFQKVLYDQGKIFVVLYSKSENNEFIVDIFDSGAGKFVKSEYFTIVPDCIKDGYAYKLQIGETGGTRIDRYKINQRIYDK